MPGYTDILGAKVPGAHGDVARGMNNLIIDPLPQVEVKRNFYIYGISTHQIAPSKPWNFEICLGNLGTYHVWSCEEGKEYGRPIVIPDPFFERFPEGIPGGYGQGNLRGKIGFRQMDGEILAKEICGINPPVEEGSDRTRWGVFYSLHNPPLASEVAAAKAKMIETYQWAVNEANMMWEDPMERKNISNIHRRAAKYLNFEADWCKTIPPQTECPACGEKLRVGVAICKACGSFIDLDKAALLGNPDAIALVEKRDAAAMSKKRN